MPVGQLVEKGVPRAPYGGHLCTMPDVKSMHGTCTTARLRAMLHLLLHGRTPSPKAVNLQAAQGKGSPACKASLCLTFHCRFLFLTTCCLMCCNAFAVAALPAPTSWSVPCASNPEPTRGGVCCHAAWQEMLDHGAAVYSRPRRGLAGDAGSGLPGDAGCSLGRQPTCSLAHAAEPWSSIGLLSYCRGAASDCSHIGLLSQELLMHATWQEMLGHAAELLMLTCGLGLAYARPGRRCWLMGQQAHMRPGRKCWVRV